MRKQNLQSSVTWLENGRARLEFRLCVKRICACISLIVELCLKDSKAQEHVGVSVSVCVCLSRMGRTGGWEERGRKRRREEKSQVRRTLMDKSMCMELLTDPFPSFRLLPLWGQRMCLCSSLKSQDLPEST